MLGGQRLDGQALMVHVTRSRSVVALERGRPPAGNPAETQH